MARKKEKKVDTSNQMIDPTVNEPKQSLVTPCLLTTSVHGLPRPANSRSASDHSIKKASDLQHQSAIVDDEAKLGHSGSSVCFVETADKENSCCLASYSNLSCSSSKLDLLKDQNITGPVKLPQCQNIVEKDANPGHGHSPLPQSKMGQTLAEHGKGGLVNHLNDAMPHNEKEMATQCSSRLEHELPKSLLPLPTIVPKSLYTHIAGQAYLPAISEASEDTRPLLGVPDVLAAAAAPSKLSIITADPDDIDDEVLTEQLDKHLKARRHSMSIYPPREPTSRILSPRISSLSASKAPLSSLPSPVKECHSAKACLSSSASISIAQSLVARAALPVAVSNMTSPLISQLSKEAKMSAFFGTLGQRLLRESGLRGSGLFSTFYDSNKKASYFAYKKKEHVEPNASLKIVLDEDFYRVNVHGEKILSCLMLKDSAVKRQETTKLNMLIELLQTELNYHKLLSLLYQFIMHYPSSGLADYDRRLLGVGISEITSLHEKVIRQIRGMFASLEKALASDGPAHLMALYRSEFGKLLALFVQLNSPGEGFIRVYSHYFKNYHASLRSRLSVLLMENETFKSACNEFMHMQENESRQSIQNIYDLPVQHITRYPSHLNGMMKNSTKDMTEDIQKVIRLMKRLCDTMNELADIEISRNKIFEIMKQVSHCPQEIVSAGRLFIRDFEAVHYASFSSSLTKPHRVRLYIFNDCLLVAKLPEHHQSQLVPLSHRALKLPLDFWYCIERSGLSKVESVSLPPSHQPLSVVVDPVHLKFRYEELAKLYHHGLKQTPRVKSNQVEDSGCEGEKRQSSRASIFSFATVKSHETKRTAAGGIFSSMMHKLSGSSKPSPLSSNPSKENLATPEPPSANHTPTTETQREDRRANKSAISGHAADWQVSDVLGGDVPLMIQFHLKDAKEEREVIHELIGKIHQKLNEKATL